MTRKIQKIPFLLFSSMMFIWGYIIPSFLDEYGKEAWIYILLGLIASILLILIVPKKVPTKGFIKIIESLYLFISIIFIFYITMNTLSNFLLIDYGVIGPFVPIVIACILMEYGGKETIFDTSTIFFFIGIIFLIIPLFLDSSSRNYELCLPIELKGNILKIFFITFLPLDLMFLYRYNINKKDVIITTSIISVICILNIVILVAVFGETFLSKMGYSGFMIYESKGPSSLFGQIDFLFLCLIPISVVFTTALRLNTLKENIGLKKSKVTSFVIAIVMTVATLIVNIRGIDLFPVLGVISILLLIWRIYGLFKRNKEVL